jgi:hypothetical protein
MTNVSKWSDTIPRAKDFNKGEVIVIVGSFHNVGLNRDYYITKYSFDHRNATGFSAADLEVYAPPVPNPPTPPEPEPPTPPAPDYPPVPVEPTDPHPQPDPTPTPTPDPEAPPAWFVKLVRDFIDWISGKLHIGGES